MGFFQSLAEFGGGLIAGSAGANLAGSGARLLGDVFENFGGSSIPSVSTPSFNFRDPKEGEPESQLASNDEVSDSFKQPSPDHTAVTDEHETDFGLLGAGLKEFISPVKKGTSFESAQQSESSQDVSFTPTVTVESVTEPVAVGIPQTARPQAPQAVGAVPAIAQASMLPLVAIAAFFFLRKG